MAETQKPVEQTAGQKLLAELRASWQRLIEIPPASADDAYNAGYACALMGANEQNCNFRFFTTPELTSAWGHGNSDAKAGRVKAS